MPTRSQRATANTSEHSANTAVSTSISAAKRSTIKAIPKGGAQLPSKYTSAVLASVVASTFTNKTTANTNCSSTLKMLTVTLKVRLNSLTDASSAALINGTNTGKIGKCWLTLIAHLPPRHPHGRCPLNHGQLSLPRPTIITTKNSASMAKPITIAVNTRAWGTGSAYCAISLLLPTNTGALSTAKRHMANKNKFTPYDKIDSPITTWKVRGRNNSHTPAAHSTPTASAIINSIA